MRDDLAPFIYLLMFGVFVLLNYLMQRLGKWLQKKQQEQERREQQKLQRQEQQKPQPPRVLTRQRAGSEPQAAAEQRGPQGRFPEVPPMAPESRTGVSRIEALPVPQLSARERPNVRALLASRRSLRDAIVIMTVLGPCRAQRPTEQD